MTDPAADSPAARLRSRVLSEDRAVFGGWLSVSSPHFLDALSASSLDYVGIDCQHGLVSEADAARLIAGSPPTTAARLVRVPANRPEAIGRVLDGGADGVIVPTVNSSREARAAVTAARFPPDGERSYGPMARFLPRDPDELGRRALVLPMIETSAGLNSVVEILAVPGVDGVYVGPADLGISLGLGPGQFPARPELEPALRTVVEAGRATGKIVGIHAGSEHFAERYVGLGFRLLTLGVETSFVTSGVERALERAGAVAGSPGAEHAAPY
ncbi:HpcH/HpaI aldolase/citrate lyase family protein [Streptomyces fuscichromogenes]|uniref:HpcH/HpaI aldolase family protein n=1 Tax=Streptomyces fuscichromogenes TaxID=1324013 RepID=UPI0037F46D44